MPNDEVSISDIFDKEFLQRFQDSFGAAVGMAVITVDNEGNGITKPTNFTDFCMKKNRGNTEACRRCVECDKNGGEMAARTGKPAVYECHAGLMDFGAPIMLGNKQIGSIIGGQVLGAPPDEEKFRAYATELGIDPDSYVNSVKDVQVLSRRRLEEAANVLHMMAGAFSSMGYFRYQLKNLAESMNVTAKHVSASMEQLAESADNVNTNQQRLNEGIEKVSEISSKINEFSNMIRNIAKQTRLLGLNASIEAARAGAAGAGFAVVSEEIGKLADGSRDTVDKIQGFTSQIAESVNETVAKSEATSDIVAQQTSDIAEVAKELISLSESAAKIIELSNSKMK